MLFNRFQGIGPRALGLILAVALPVAGHAQGASPSGRGKRAAPASEKSRSSSPAPGRGAQKGNEFQTYLNAAVRLYENLEYEQALDKLARAKRYVRGVEDDVTISLYEGIILADLGRKQQSQVAFREGLLLRPEARLPVRVSPKVEREFEALRKDVRGELERLRAKQEAEQPAVAPPEPPPEPTIAVAPSPPSPEATPPTASPALTPGVTEEAPRSRVLPYSLLGGGALLAGSGVALGLSALSFNDRKRELTANEALQERDKASTQLTVGTVLVGGGLAALGTGVALLLLPQGTPGQGSPSASLHLTPLPGGFALGTAGQF